MKIELNLPSENKEHLYADFIELKTLLSPTNVWVTISNVIDHYNDEKNLSEQNLNDLQKTDEDDKLKSKFETYFKLIEYRSSFLEGTYPFCIEQNKIQLKETLNDKHYFYLYLLIASNLNYFKSSQNQITKDFEKISEEVLKNYLNGNIIPLGENSTLKGNTKEKLQNIAKTLNITVREDEINKISNNANKDKGVDLIGFKPFKDKISNMIIILSQCACGKEWYKKTNETKRYEHFLDFYKLLPIHAMFIPYGLLISENDFEQSEELKDRLVFERMRILEYAKNFNFVENPNMKKMINDILNNPNMEV